MAVLGCTKSLSGQFCQDMVSVSGEVVKGSQQMCRVRLEVLMSSCLNSA